MARSRFRGSYKSLSNAILDFFVANLIIYILCKAHVTVKLIFKGQTVKKLFFHIFTQIAVKKTPF